MTRSRLVGILNAVEARTAEPEQNQPTLVTPGQTNLVPPVSEARKELTDMYSALQNLNYLQVYGAAGTVQHPYYPAEGDGELVSPNLLEKITGFPMSSLTPKNSNKAFLYAGFGLCILEAIASYISGIPLDGLVIFTIIAFMTDKLTTNGAILETILKTLYPQYAQKVLKHEAGHFLCAYLLGLPVEGCVLSAWAALEDSRFQNQVTAGTSFFDPELSSDILDKNRVSKRSIDRYSIVVMAGIAAEAMNWDQAEGGAGDEMALAAFLAQMTGGPNKGWDYERIRNQARWGASQAVLLLRHYKVCYEALVDTLERGNGTLGECVYAIENAAREHNIRPLDGPLGYYNGQVESWQLASVVSTPPVGAATVAGVLTDATKENGVPIQSPSLVTSKSSSSSQELLEELVPLRAQMEEKMKEIERQLKDLDNGGSQ